MAHSSSANCRAAPSKRCHPRWCASSSASRRPVQVRIVAGRLKGRRLDAPAGRDIRPTADRTRQALFDVLEHGHLTEDGGSALVDAIVLDAFCGTGALGLEALSRGAAEASFMDINNAALDCA